MIQKKYNVALVITYDGHNRITKAIRNVIVNNRWLLFLYSCFVPMNIWNVAKNIHVIETKTLDNENIKNILWDLKPTVIIVASWGELIKSDIVTIPEHGIINCHLSYLPHYKGCGEPVIEALKNRDQFTGVTFHYMNEKFDSGPIIAQQKLNIDNNETYKSLLNKCSIKAAGMIDAVLEDVFQES